MPNLLDFSNRFYIKQYLIKCLVKPEKQDSITMLVKWASIFYPLKRASIIRPLKSANPAMPIQRGSISMLVKSADIIRGGQ